ncbi:hypothetical protein IY72_02980 [Brucella suis]|uniref:Uncharacterized protein n=1 Tax=Brucella suis TaxID=29461 RepID=A0AAU8QMS5_BRUSS|nr:hypothetical protein IY72_02980 [Brucella suis]
MEFRFIDTNAQTTELDIRELHDGAAAGFITIFTIYARIVRSIVEAQFGEGLEGAEFGFRTGGNAECETSALVPAIAVGTGVNVIAALYVVTDVTMDAQAGFGARTTRAAAEPRRRLLMFISDLQSKLKMGLGILIWLKDNLSPSPN